MADFLSDLIADLIVNLLSVRACVFILIAVICIWLASGAPSSQDNPPAPPVPTSSSLGAPWTA